MSQKPVTDKYVQFRGEPRALVSHKSSLVFVTVHPEQQATALYRLDLEDARLSADPLPRGAVALDRAGDRVYLAGDDGLLFTAPLTAGAPTLLGGRLDPPASALVCAGVDRLALLCGAELVIVNAADGKALQRLPLPADGTALASDASGRWLAVGCAEGTLAIFSREESEAFTAGSTGRLHDGAITALLFDTGELRVISAAVDNHLLVTHARGALEPEVRDGKSGHSEAVYGLVHGLGGRFYSAGRDQTIKAWPGTVGQKRPTTFKDRVGKVVALTMTEFRGKPHLAAACDDATLRIFALDDEGKPSERALIVHGAYGWAVKTLRRKDPAIREDVLKTLFRYNDAQSIELLGNQGLVDEDHDLKVLATKLLGESENPRAIKELEKLIKAPEEAVRIAAFTGLRALEGEESLRPLELALGVGRRDVGVLAIEALARLAIIDELAMDRLVKALGDEPREVRFAALYALEGLHDERSPEANLLALRSQRADVRERALVRLWQRGLIEHGEVRAALRRHSADGDANVRHTAFHLSLLTRETLQRALRARDPQLHRALHEIETAPTTRDEEVPRPELPEAAPVDAAAVSEADRMPLLEAMASRDRDTCLAGASGLASLADPRALGTLLQLTRDSAPEVRVATCKALRALGDPRGAGRLRLLLRDGHPSVRDAAFTALAQLEVDKLLGVAEAGLMAEHEDVRRRGLELLVSELKRTRAAKRKASEGRAATREVVVVDVEEVEEIDPEDSIAELELEAAAAIEAVDDDATRKAKEARKAGLRLLERALCDASRVIRGEAFKAVLNLEISGGGSRSLRFARRSIHADIRREVLTEVTAQISESWAWPLLLELFEDPDPGVRGEAFKFAMKRTKGIGLEPLYAALKGPYTDLRIEATRILGKRKAEGIRALLSTAVSDTDETVRQLAVDALLVNEAEDTLRDAMKSEYPDVAVRAAEARAIHGDPGAEAPLLAALAEKEPEVSELRAKWVDRVTRALSGLAELGKPDARDKVTPLLQHKDSQIRRRAATALAWMARPDALAELRDALQHADPVVRREAALGLAFCGDASGASILFASGDAEVPAMMRLYAALALGVQAEDVFAAFLDHSSEPVRERAMLLLLMSELAENDGVPDRCLAALAAAHPRVRLTAALALENFGDAELFTQFVCEQFNSRGDNKPPWTAAADIVKSLAELIAHGDIIGNPQLKVRAARQLEALAAEKQETFDRGWDIFARRNANAIAERQSIASMRAKAEPAYAPEELRQIVFGAYAGLSRLPGGVAETRIRQTAIARLLKVDEADPARRDAVISVLRLALVDSQAVIRKLAFESLQTLGMPSAALATEALASGYRDAGALGLKLLANLGSAEEGIAVLRDVLVQHTDGLEHEAAKLIVELRGGPSAAPPGETEVGRARREKARRSAWIEVYNRALEARSEGLRDEVVRGLAGFYEEGGAGPAATGLRKALKSRFRKVRFAAAGLLAERGDAAAFDVLVDMLRSDRVNEQREAIGKLQRLGDPRAPAAFMDRIDRDPAGTARIDELLRAAGEARRVEYAGRLIGYLDDPKRRAAAWSALLTVSGHDQRIEDPEDTGAGALGWEERQHPRHDDVLALMMEAGYRLGDDRLLGLVIPAARWSRRSAVDPALASLCDYTRPGVRHQAVAALGWRVRKRGAPVDALLNALHSGDPETQFLAAEGLALAGYSEGVTVLLTSVDFLPDLGQRRRAVAALGELADARALDPLLRLVGDEGHALREQAAEALGHMGKAAPEKAEKVFELLTRLAKGTGGVALQALTGLRWFGTRDAWALIRERARDDHWQVRERVAALLRHNEDPATQALLVDRIKREGYYRVAQALAKSYRELCGADSLEPDYVFLQSSVRNLEPDTPARLRERGDPARLLALLSTLAQEEHRPALVASLMTRVPLPIDEAAQQLDSPHEGTAGVAAQILGHAGVRVADAHGPALVAATRRLRIQWGAELALARERRKHRLAEITPPLSRAIWACGRVGVGGTELIAASRLGGDGPEGRPLRWTAILALTTGNTGGDPALVRLAEVSLGSDAELRTIAAAGLAARAPGRAAGLVKQLLDDRASLGRLLSPEVGAEAAARDALGDAAANVHYQGVAMPHLIARRDVTTLGAVMLNAALPEATRLGAIEGLARIASDAALKSLVHFARGGEATDITDDDDEELRMAAWRAIRRARRQRDREEQATTRHYRWEVEV
ncbi:MAG: HEAT repeat domain-containing protein [Myxococcales bacterium]|nr:HEAT repeat domain-containing protein [Myxococcales bacterium]